MNLYDGVLKFEGTWRTYQKRVLDRSQDYLTDKKVHIVAAPGSGKTTLGIELIRRLGKPCLILTPSVTIRQQWISRIEEGFLEKSQDPGQWISNEIKNPRALTVITYQALHSAMKQYAGVLKEESEDFSGKNAEETVDYSGFDLFRTMEEAGIGTICLDEAHHLRSEWWKALEEFLKKVSQMTFISLTATPPYDSTPAQWKRYIDLCGPIDEEIFTPELVKEGSLCPHQDYVYFNWPLQDEISAVEEYCARTEEIMQRLITDREFISMIASHRGILSPEEYSEKFLDEPKYFSSILIFLHASKVPFPNSLKELTGTSERLPNLDQEWLEALLQGFLYDDTESYPCDTVYREELIRQLKSAGCIYKNKVRLTKNEEVTKLLVSSRGKLNSINDIVRAEAESLGTDLRLLVLCDFIKKEMLSAVGNLDKDVGAIGAVPVFESIRRQQIPGVRLGVLSGSVIIVPSDTEERLHELLREYGCEGRLSSLGNTGYSMVNVKGKSHNIVMVITELFTEGSINTLVGTKSLLGEGWDSPCINTLILATYVGSFMLSNQMRGRAIRVFKGEPEKTSNIWHLACVMPRKLQKTANSPLAGDYETLVRRFESFLGVSYGEAVIESGIERLDMGIPDSRRKIEKNNEKMLEKAADRAGLRKSWEKSLKVIHDTMSVEEVEEVDKRLLEPGCVFFNAVAFEIASGILLVLFFLLRLAVSVSVQSLSFLGILFSMGMLISFLAVCRYGYRIVSLCTPQKRMKKAAEGMLKALAEIGLLDEPEHCRAAVEEAEVAVFAYLRGGSTRDKTLFASCLAEFWGMIDNPRYLLTEKKGRKGNREYYAVPEILGRKKEDAQYFCICMKKALGPCEAVYTRTAEGRKLLLKARTRSFVNKNDRLLTGKKKVKGKFE